MVHDLCIITERNILNDPTSSTPLYPSIRANHKKTSNHSIPQPSHPVADTTTPSELHHRRQNLFPPLLTPTPSSQVSSKTRISTINPRPSPRRIRRDEDQALLCSRRQRQRQRRTPPQAPWATTQPPQLLSKALTHITHLPKSGY